MTVWLQFLSRLKSGEYKSVAINTQEVAAWHIEGSDEYPGMSGIITATLNSGNTVRIDYQFNGRPGAGKLTAMQTDVESIWRSVTRQNAAYNSSSQETSA